VDLRELVFLYLEYFIFLFIIESIVPMIKLGFEFRLKQQLKDR